MIKDGIICINYFISLAMNIKISKLMQQVTIFIKNLIIILQIIIKDDKIYYIEPYITFFKDYNNNNNNNLSVKMINQIKNFYNKKHNK